MGEHQHTSRCYEWMLNCGKHDHQHGSRCYNKDGQLTCSITEHSHVGSCDIYTPTCGH